MNENHEFIRLATRPTALFSRLAHAWGRGPPGDWGLGSTGCPSCLASPCLQEVLTEQLRQQQELQRKLAKLAKQVWRGGGGDGVRLPCLLVPCLAHPPPHATLPCEPPPCSHIPPSPLAPPWSHACPTPTPPHPPTPHPAPPASTPAHPPDGPPGARPARGGGPPAGPGLRAEAQGRRAAVPQRGGGLQGRPPRRLGGRPGGEAAAD